VTRVDELTVEKADYIKVRDDSFEQCKDKNGTRIVYNS
jgi:hypothetical protein